MSDVEYQGQGRHDASGAPPSEWVGAPRVSTRREEEMGERKQLGKRVSSLSASPGGPSCAGKRWWESGKEGREGGCSASRLAPLKVLGSQQALW